MSVVLLEMRQQQQLYNKFQHIGPINCWEFVVYCIGFVYIVIGFSKNLNLRVMSESNLRVTDLAKFFCPP